MARLPPTGRRFNPASFPSSGTTPGLYLIQVKADPPAFLTQPADGNLWLLGQTRGGTASMAIRFEAYASGVWPGGG